jgi:hypothetical protein
MRSVQEYLAKAAEFDAMATGADAPPAIRKRYADLAECYRLLAHDRERMITEGLISADPPLV